MAYHNQLSYFYIQITSLTWMKSVRYYRYLSTILGLVILVSVISYLRPPGWIYVEKNVSTSHLESVIKISREELEEFPSILEAIQLTDASLGRPPNPVKCNNSEGTRIVKHFGGLPFIIGGDYRVHLDVDGQIYSIFILFVQKPPPMA